MKRLNGMDAMLLYSETPNLHTHTLKVFVIEAADFDVTSGSMSSAGPWPDGCTCSIRCGTSSSTPR